MANAGSIVRFGTGHTLQIQLDGLSIELTRRSEVWAQNAGLEGLEGAQRLAPAEADRLSDGIQDRDLDTEAMRQNVEAHADPVRSPTTFDGRYRDLPEESTFDDLTLGARGTTVENWQAQMEWLYRRTGDEGYNLNPEGRFRNQGVDGLFGEQSQRVFEHWRAQGSPRVGRVEVLPDEPEAAGPDATEALDGEAHTVDLETMLRELDALLLEANLA